MKDVDIVVSTSEEDTRDDGSLPSNATFIEIFQRPNTTLRTTRPDSRFVTKFCKWLYIALRNRKNADRLEILANIAVEACVFIS
jgi:hypothetical protein